MPESIVVYGATDCEDTQRTRERLRSFNLPFREINIDHDAEAERFVIFINGGQRSTPTVVIGAGRHKVLITEPTNEEIDALALEAGYRLT